MPEKFQPEYVDKGEIDPEKLVEIYADFGLARSYDEPARYSISELEGTYGDLTNEILYLKHIGAVNFTSHDEIEMRSSENKIAKRIESRIYWDGTSSPSEVLEQEEGLPSYILEPKIEEERHPSIDGEQDPNLTIISELLGALGDEPASETDIISKLPGEPTFDTGFWLEYLETQGAATRTDSGYILNEGIDLADIDVDISENTRSLKERNRYGNDPWKP